MQTYLAQYVQQSYSKTDSVVVGTNRSIKNNMFFTCPHRYVSTRLSRVNKKFSLLPLFWVLVTSVWFNKKQVRVECGNIYPSLLCWILSIVKRDISYRIFTYGTELLVLKHKSLKSRIIKRVLTGAEKLYVLGPYTQSLLENAGITTQCEVVAPKISLSVTGYEQRITARRMSLEYSQLSLRIVCVGRLEEHKGQAVLIEAFQKCRILHQAHLVLIGNGPCYAALINQIDRLQCKECVTIIPHATDTDKHAEYAKAYCVVVPSFTTHNGTEGFGIVCLEAMSFGVPLIVSDCGGLPDVAGDAALICTQNNTESLYEALCMLLQTPRCAQALSDKGKNIFLARHRIDPL